MDQSLEISAIPAFSDNYIWLLRRRGEARCVVVDPGDHRPVLEALRSGDLKLAAILLTHHHWDHAGGVDALLEAVGESVPVYGPDDDRLGPWCTPCREGDRVTVPELELAFEVLEVPAHTRSHIAFHGHGMLFSGDTLFSVGCGRLFEGSPADMQRAMDKLAALPGDTRVFCGHEYTVSNCRFALQVEPENEALQERAQEAQRLRERDEITLPSTLEQERAVNPFMRTHEPAVVAAARDRDPSAEPGAATLGVIRAWKDSL
jgi:hydroxyacylglutathione hydrolase